MTDDENCDFCYRRAVTQVTRHRRTLIEFVLDRPRKSVLVCNDHIGRGIEHVR